MALIASTVAGFSSVIHAENISAKDDYIKNCQFATCVGLAGLRWSKEHPYGVAVAVRMGTKPAVIDDQIKQVITRDLNHHGITEIKFFYENQNAPATGMSLHVRGGTEGPLDISNVRQELKVVAERAKMTAPVYLPK